MRDFSQRPGHPNYVAPSGSRADIIPLRIGPTEPDPDMVICPHCTSQFHAVPTNVQARLHEREHDRAAVVSIIAETLARTQTVPSTEGALQLADDIVKALEASP